MARIYIAAAKGEALLADEVGACLHEMGHTITSTWHSTGPIDRDPEDTRQRSGVAETCRAQIKEAEVLVALLHVGAPCGAYTEAGIALGLGLTVSWFTSTQGQSNVFDSARDAVRNAFQQDAWIRDPQFIAAVVAMDLPSGKL